MKKRLTLLKIKLGMNELSKNKLLQRNPDLGILILRLSIGILMLLHGISKMTNGIGMIENIVVTNGLPAFIAYGVYIGEVIAPMLIILGVATRFSAVVFAVNCLVATLLVHSSVIFTLGKSGGWAIELLGLFFFGALALIFTGGGKYALSRKYIWD